MDIEHIAGNKLDNNKIESLLGLGGMSVVYWHVRYLLIDHVERQRILLTNLRISPNKEFCGSGTMDFTDCAPNIL